MTLTVGSLFSGIGGLDLGLERAGMEVIWQSEIDPYACKVLSKHWPEVVNHGNIKEIKWEEVERPDVICGGYPCQPFSTAGKRRGEEDPRHLWPWVREAISRLRPDYAILENVRGHLSMGGLSVIGELASIGYDAEWRVVSAASVGANHRRDRIIIVAYPNSIGSHREKINPTNTGEYAQCEPSRRCEDVANPNSAPGQQQCQWEVCKPNIGRCCKNVADTDNDGSSSSTFAGGSGETTKEQSSRKNDSTNAEGCGCIPEELANTNCGQCEQCQSESKQVSRLSSGSQSIPNPDGDRGRRIRSLADGRNPVFGRQTELRGENGYAGWQWWETEPDVGRVAHGIPNRVDRLRGLGNAVVPQVAEVIGRLVMAHAKEEQ